MAGDNVALLLRGVKRGEVVRGHVVCARGSTTPHTRFEAPLYTLRPEEGATAIITIELGKPVAMEEGLGFAVREGGKTVAAGTSPSCSPDPMALAIVLGPSVVLQQKSIDTHVGEVQHGLPMARIFTAERMRGGQALSSFGAYACQPGSRLHSEPKPGRRDAANAGSPVVRW